MKRRRFSADGVMHVYQRTHWGFNLFYSAEDFLVFYTIVSIQVKKTGICLLGMCLMIDHIHLLLSADNLETMSRFISAYTSLYAREFNTRTGREGPLFESPYGCAVKLDLKKIRSSIAYLYNNPVEKHLCKKAEQYRWNFLSYYELPFRMGHSSYSRKLKRSMNIVEDSYKKGRYLNYRLLYKIMEGLDINEKNGLREHIIRTFFPFEKNRLISYYGSYRSMLTAINSNTGSEYDIPETNWCKSDKPYREILSYIKRTGIEDMHTILTMSLEDKYRIMSLLQKNTSASSIQIMKFLHIPSNTTSPKGLK